MVGLEQGSKFEGGLGQRLCVGVAALVRPVMSETFHNCVGDITVAGEQCQAVAFQWAGLVGIVVPQLPQQWCRPGSDPLCEC